METQHASGAVAGDELLSLRDVVRFVRRHGLLILGLSAAAGAVVLAANMLLVPRRFEAASTLIISRQVSDGLTAGSLQRVLESGAVVRETRRRLVNSGALAAEAELAVGENLHATIVAGGDRSAPLLEARGVAASPDQAATLANTWAVVFLEHASNLEADRLRDGVGPLELSLETRQVALEEMQDDWEQQVRAFRDGITAIQKAWDEKEAAYRKTTEELLVEVRQTSRDQMWGAVRGFLKPVEERAAGRADTRDSGRVRELLLELLVLRQQLGQRLRVVTLRNSVGGDTLWEVVSSTSPETTQGADSSSLDRPLLTQQLEPSYPSLETRAAAVEAELRAAAADQPEIQSIVEDLQRLQDRATEQLAKLHEDRNLGLAKLVRDRSRQVHEREWAFGRAQAEYNRMFSQANALIQSLADQLTSTRVEQIKAESALVTLLAEAGGRARPMPRHSLLRAAAAAFLAGLLGIAIAIVREVGEDEDAG